MMRAKMQGDTSSMGRERERWERESGRKGRSEDFFRQQDVERTHAQNVKARKEFWEAKNLGDVGYHKAGVKHARKEIRRYERQVAKVKACGGYDAKLGSVAYVEANQLTPAKGRLKWHLSKLDKIRREKRRTQLRKARQAYERRHPERANRFAALREKA
jgi:hypothetical protein